MGWALAHARNRHHPTWRMLVRMVIAPTATSPPISRRRMLKAMLTKPSVDCIAKVKAPKKHRG